MAGASSPRQLSDQELDSMLPRVQTGNATVKFRGGFEGLWTDRTDVEQLVDRRFRSGQLSSSEVTLLADWVENGYVVLEGAAPRDWCEELKRDLRAAFEDGDERLRVLSPGEHFGSPLTAGTDMRGQRVNDVYAYFESARRLLFAEPIVRFLQVVFDAPPLLLQSLTFEVGTQQGFHQDTAYVVIDPPLALAACWIALEDIRLGSGELMYFEGSHRLPDHVFGEGLKCWHPALGAAVHDEYLAALVHRSEAAGLRRRTFQARQGDVLIWSADLAHGGAPVTDGDLTRRSLVGHYCPDWAVPRYFDQFPDHATRVAYGGGSYASTHYLI